tara:strand:+ start:381 stop:635 length:255 start_codon:yes stop_codon:yes gene_type:complete
MAKEDIVNSRYKKGKSDNPIGRPKGSLNRKTIARIYLSYLQEEVNPLTGIKELLSNEDMITLALILNLGRIKLNLVIVLNSNLQ